jgi:hypothetical protein
MRRLEVVVLVLIALGATATSPGLAAPREKAVAKSVTPSTTRQPVDGELAELARAALASSPVRLPKGTKVVAARPSTATDVRVPIAPSRVTIDLTAPARRVGPVVATAVLVFWKDSDIAARIPLRLDLSVPPEALVYDVPKGGVVTLVVRRGLVEVSAQAVTSSDADIGDVVQVLLRPSGRALRAELVAKDRALAVEDGR